MENLYAENYCRFCSELFCCEKCRFKHEKRVHNLVIDCNICIYGKMYYRNVSCELQEHIRTVHLPVMCQICKKKFCYMFELTENHKCVQPYDSPINRLNTESMIISGNMETKFGENNCALNLPATNVLVTSTPVGISEVYEIRIDTLPLSSPPDQNASEEYASTKAMNDRTPVDCGLESNICNSQLFPLVTPLRSIIAKAKSQHNSGEKKRRVKFFDNDFATVNEDQKSMKTHSKTNDETYSKKVYFPYDDISPSTPKNCQPEEFYTPQEHTYEKVSDSKEYTTGISPDDLEKNVDEKNNSSSSITNFWTSMASAFKHIFFQPTISTPDVICNISHPDYTDSSKSTKRLLSPGTERYTPNIKRICTRESKKMSRRYYESHP
ncbi:hypothetical protein CBL_14399 [Carabus blaptoides fortunei]